MPDVVHIRAVWLVGRRALRRQGHARCSCRRVRWRPAGPDHRSLRPSGVSRASARDRHHAAVEAASIGLAVASGSSRPTTSVPSRAPTPAAANSSGRRCLDVEVSVRGCHRAERDAVVVHRRQRRRHAAGSQVVVVQDEVPAGSDRPIGDMARRPDRPARRVARRRRCRRLGRGLDAPGHQAHGFAASSGCDLRALPDAKWPHRGR